MQVHKYYTKTRGGGSITAFLETKRILEKNGHQVLVFAMQDADNFPCPESSYFSEHFDLNSAMSWKEKFQVAKKIIYNQEAKEKLARLIAEKKPQLAHLHNIYHYLSPSIVDALAKQQVPMVMTLHDYKLICPAYKLYADGLVCNLCRRKCYIHCLLNKCLKQSVSASFLGMLEAYVHRFKGTYAKIDQFIAPSQFIKDKHVEFGIPANKIQVMRYPIDLDRYEQILYPTPEEADFFVYYGRLSEEKGILNLLQAVARLKSQRNLGATKLLIIGKGPQEEQLKNKIKELGLHSNVEMIGFKTGTDLFNLVQKAKFVVVPSVWYDNSPLVVIESHLLRKPVVISDLGGTKESIIANQSGLIFPARQVGKLAYQIAAMLKYEPRNRMRMGERGRLHILKLHDEKQLYAELLNLYQTVLESKKR